MPSNKDLTPFEQEKLEKIKENIDNTNVDKDLLRTDTNVEEIKKEIEIDKKNSPRIETPIGTEISQEDLDRAAGVKNPKTNKPVQETKFAKDLKEILVNVSQERLSKITDALRKNILKLERVKPDGSGVVVENKDYIPLTIGMNKKVMKVMKRARILREDIMGLGKENGGLMVSDIQKKYPDILDEDITQDELMNDDVLNELIGNYVVAQKAKIYWGIEDIDNYVLSDIILIIGLYEQRNNFTPT